MSHRLSALAAFALLFLASCATSSPSVTVRELDDGCATQLVSAQGMETSVRWNGDVLEVQYFSFDGPPIKDSARIEKVIGDLVKLSYEHVANDPYSGAPVELCGPTGVVFAIHSLPKAKYRVEVSPRLPGQ